MEKCPVCGTQLRVDSSYLTFVNDHTPDKQTEAYTNLEMVCTNATLHQDLKGKIVIAPCPMYVGDGKDKPKHIIKTIKHKVNSK